MHETRFDDPARWWFLTREGFSEFKRDPVAQGYEVLSRHQDFPHLRTKTEDGEQIKTEDGEPVTCLEYGSSHLPRPTWEQLDSIARQSFLSNYKFELHRMGLMEVAWLGPKAITFNCTEGVDSIRAAAHYWLAETGLFHHAPADGEDFSGYSPTRWQPKPAERETHQLKFSVSARGNPDLVTVSWGKLVEAFKNDERYSEHVRSALRTFLEHDPDYRAYRKERLDALECRCRRLKKRITDLKKEARKLAQKGKTDDKAKEEYKEILRHIAAHENSLRHLRRRLKKPSPKVIALGCAAWDCQQEGSLLPEQITRNQLETISLKGNTEPDPRYAMRRLRKLQEQAGCFKKKSPKKGRSKRVSQVAEPISVVETLYPGIKLRT